MATKLSDQAFRDAGLQLQVPAASVRAFTQVESPNGGFDANGVPYILFEGHWFHQLTNGVYSKSYPSISYRDWTRDHYAKGANATIRNGGEHKRLQTAASLNREAALKSASWGGFQILGVNHKSAGFDTIQQFVNAMYAGADEQLAAYVQFILRDKRKHPVTKKTLHEALIDRDWDSVAYLYNGSKYAENNYAGKLASEFKLSQVYFA